MATIPSLATQSAGGMASAAGWANLVQAGFVFYNNVPSVTLNQSTAQTGIVTATYTPITWDTEEHDNDGAHSTITNTSRITIVTAGKLWVSGCIAWGGSATGQRISRWAINGTAVNGTETLITTPHTGSAAYLVYSGILQVSVGDFVELQGWQNTGGNLSLVVTGAVRSRISLFWMST